MSNINIDGIDKIILRSLMKDARTPVLEISRNVGISGAAIHQRLRKLEIWSYFRFKICNQPKSHGV
jgi:Lrp/AsnC family transcriptional regulator for asnA, asnC and gidA